MRRYRGDSGGGRGAYGSAAAQMNQQQQQNRSGYYQGRHQEQQEKDPNHHHNQWRWERDGGHNKLPMNSMSPHASLDEGQGYQAPRSYYQDQRPEPQMPLEKQSSDPRHQPRKEDMDIGYEDNRISQTFEGLEQRFLDDIMKLSKEQTDAEDVENARHQERINTINIQYQEQLAALRARHATRRNEVLRRESRARQQQYQQAAMDQYPNSHMGTSDPHGERSRFSGSARDQGFEPKVQYPGGRIYDTDSRHY
ncbi:unnamed protein product [Fraxinus pennsylvanica]|uniref:Uncharacterized protein n=1 Tax=Fraxinus pennsylvanica TaxID=56036 RepID=A0AAD2E853_9LAMI|nr:unnamed protein product [Fraxinus pennsylvanica]